MDFTDIVAIVAAVVAIGGTIASFGMFWYARRTYSIDYDKMHPSDFERRLTDLETTTKIISAKFDVQDKIVIEVNTELKHLNQNLQLLTNRIDALMLRRLDRDNDQ